MCHGSGTPPAIPDTLSKNTICILENDSTWRGTFGHRKVRDIPTPTTGMVNRRGGYGGIAIYAANLSVPGAHDSS